MPSKGCGSMDIKYVFYEWHDSCGSSWNIHLLGCCLPRVISWCHHLAQIRSAQKLTPVFCAY
jgi:hypothetical protein